MTDGYTLPASITPGVTSMPKSKIPQPEDIDTEGDDEVLAEFETRQQMEPNSERWHSLDKDDPSDELEQFDPAPPEGR
jgi:hypothetical protein